MKKLPTKVAVLCKCGAYIVGSYADYLIGKGKTFKDYDLIVPPNKWFVVALLIPKNAKLNSFGGWKFKDSVGNSIDVWPMSIEVYLRQYTKSKKQAYVLDYINNKIFTCLIAKEL